MSNKKPFAAILVLLIGLLAACQPAGGDPGAAEPTVAATPEATPATVPAVGTPATDPTAATTAAVAQLAADLGLTESDIEVLSAEPTEFSDGCLGLGGPEESCLQAITPGWLIRAQANGQEYEVHTDETGMQVRVAGDMAGGDAGADTASAAVQEFLAAQLGVALGDVQVVSAQKTEFSDGCLGLGGPEEMCLQAITPGWLVMVTVNGQPYEAHTDEAGTQVRIAPEGSSDPSDPDAATAAAITALAQQLGVAESDIEVTWLEGADYTDSCLGLGQPDESCAQVITLGWLMRLTAASQTYEVHTDGTGQIVRIAPSQ